MYTDIASACTYRRTYLCVHGCNFSKSFWPWHETIEIRKNIYIFFFIRFEKDGETDVFVSFVLLKNILYTHASASQLTCVCLEGMSYPIFDVTDFTFFYSSKKVLI